MYFFSNLKSGIPYLNIPPIFSLFSKIVTSIPARASHILAVIPAGPAPTIATFSPICFGFWTSRYQPFSIAISPIALSISPIETGSPLIPLTQLPWHCFDLGQIFPTYKWHNRSSI